VARAAEKANRTIREQCHVSYDSPERTRLCQVFRFPDCLSQPAASATSALVRSQSNLPEFCSSNEAMVRLLKQN
jgi:hypothetical protein